VEHRTLDHLDDLHQATTPGPWELADGGWGVYVTAADGEHVWARGDVPNAHDCAFTVEAHRQWPHLIAAIRRLRGELEAAHRLLAANTCEQEPW
jgi:hypothetical protein